MCLKSTEISLKAYKKVSRQSLLQAAAEIGLVVRRYPSQ
jgi:hypothetical protein